MKMGSLLFLLGALLGIAQTAHSETVSESEFYGAMYSDIREVVIAAKEVLATQKEEEVATQQRQIPSWLLEVAYADDELPPLGEECFYGGWKSVRGGKGCSRPAGSTTTTCGKDFTCNPIIFGEGVCVDFSTSALRQTTFSRCESTFQSKAAKDKKDPYEFLKGVLADKAKRDDLMSLISSALAVCGTGVQSKTPMCRRLEAKVSVIQKKAKVLNTDKKDITKNNEKPNQIQKPEVKNLSTINPPQKKDQLDKDNAACTACPGQNGNNPLGKDKTKLIDITQAPVVLTAAELGKLKIKHADIMKQIQTLIPEYKDKPSFASLPFNPKQDVKDAVYTLSQERLCVELQIFRSENKLNFDLDCTKKPYRFPALSVEVIKSNGMIERKVAMEKYSITARLPSSPVSYYIETPTGRVLFKTVDEVTVQSKEGPKTKFGDMRTPEGKFSLGKTKKNSDYFISTHVGYESWAERDNLLSSLPQKERNPNNPGGAIKIHGTGGSDGCISIPNSEAALVAAWVDGAPEGKSSIEIFPVKMTNENINKLSTKTGNEKYKEFWNKLKTIYEDSQKKVVPDCKSINLVM